MEAETLSRKKTTISKGKLKESIKNVLCRPDPVFWPIVTEECEKKLLVALNKYKVPIPEYKKPQWKELKLIPKEKRPKPPALKKVDGFLFGISECSNAIQKRQCSAVIIESTISPRTIIQPTLEACITANIPVVCMNYLRKTSFNNFGISTSCLGIKIDCIIDLKNEILEITKSYKSTIKLENNINTEDMEFTVETNTSLSDKKQSIVVDDLIPECPYLYRTSKKCRVFVPSEGTIVKDTKEFKGQDFIEFSDKQIQKPDSKSYMKMIVKRISNNPNRVKRK